ncbi:MAG: hypothetical protein PHR30_16535 [Gallionellaceae bacterium]|nr:hypothetical protein [Gallionellaceae bacterium]
MESQFTVTPHTHYHVECYDKHGTHKWTEDFPNLVTVLGRARLLNCIFGAYATTEWHVGLKAGGEESTADTLDSHAGWAESRCYAGNRPAFTNTTATSGEISNAGNVAVFTVNTDASSIAGAFLTNSSDSSGGAPEIIYGVGEFASTRVCSSGDTLNVTITATITSST